MHLERVASGIIRPSGGRFQSPPSRILPEIPVEQRGGRSVAPAQRESAHLENPDTPVKRDRDHIAAFDFPTRRRDSRAIDPDMTGLRERGRGRAGAHDPDMP
jgi:hypothetical protein